MLKNAPVVSPAGFQYTAVASSATATNAPAIPVARVPIDSKTWAGEGVALRKARARRRVRDRTYLELAYQNRRRDHRGPEPLLAPYGRLRHVLGSHNLVREPVDLFLLVPAPVGIEIQAEGGGEHLRS